MQGPGSLRVACNSLFVNVQTPLVEPGLVPWCPTGRVGDALGGVVGGAHSIRDMASSRRASLSGMGLGLRRGSGSLGEREVVQSDGKVVGSGGTEESEAEKEARRRASLTMMHAGSMSGGMNDAMKEHICKQSGISDSTSAKEKMNIVLKLAKEKGKTAEQIFKSARPAS